MNERNPASARAEPLRAFFVTCGGHEQGLGHLVRCLNVLGGLRELKGRVQAKIVAFGDDAAAAFLERSGEEFDLVPIGIDPLDLARRCEQALIGFDADLAVHDALESASSVMAVLCKHARNTLTVDDRSNAALRADLAVNALYPRFPGASWSNEWTALGDAFLGPNFAAAHKVPFEPKQKASRVFVAQGGADTFGMLPRIAAAVREMRNLTFVFALGPAFRHELELAQACQGGRFEIARNTADMAALMASCDFAVSGGGVTLFELAAVGVPAIGLTAEPPELETIERFVEIGFARSLGCASADFEASLRDSVEQLASDKAARARMSAAGRNVIDGRGIERALSHLLALRKAA